MKSSKIYLLPAFALAVLAPSAWAEKEVIIRRLDVDGPLHGLAGHKDGDKMEKEKVTFLGIETAPVSRTLAAQLGLAHETGLVVTHIAEKSPAADVLKEDDVLTKFEDQILVNMQQLGVLVRSKKEGEEVRLTVVRGGKETTVKAKLGVHDVPKLANAFFYHNGGPGGFNLRIPGPDEDSAGFERLRGLPGMGAEHARDVMRMIARERGNFMTGPGVHILGHAGQDSTIVDLPKSNISYSDDDGSIEIKVDDGKRNLTVKNTKGVVAFDGPITTEAERKKLPAEVIKRLEKLETDTMSVEAGGDFQPEVVPLPPEPARTKISHLLGQGGARDSRPF